MSIMDGNGKMQSDRWVDFAPAGPGTPSGKYLRKFWQPIALSSSLGAGKTLPVHVMGEKFTLYRGVSGTPYVVGFRCAHRSTQLTTGWVRDDSIQCMYHGWTYNGEGKCIARPGEDPPGPAPRANIPSYPAREHLGLIYGWFGEGEAPDFPTLEFFKDEAVIENHALDFPANWFQTMENHFDETHIAFVHTFGGSHDNLGCTYQLPEMKIYETNYGMVRETKVAGGKLRKTLYFMPNVMRIMIPTFLDLADIGGWRDSYIVLVPTDDENHRAYFTQNVHVNQKDMGAYQEMHERFREKVAAAPSITQLTHEILAGKGHINDYLDHPYLLLLEDAITQGGQGQIVDRSLELLGRTDAGVAAMRRVWDREIRSFAEGKPTKYWVYRGEEPTLGFDDVPASAPPATRWQ